MCTCCVAHIRCKAITYTTSVGNDLSSGLGMCLQQDRYTSDACSQMRPVGTLLCLPWQRRDVPSAWFKKNMLASLLYKIKINLQHMLFCCFRIQAFSSCEASKILVPMTRQMGHPSSARASKGDCPPASAESKHRKCICLVADTFRVKRRDHCQLMLRK